MPKVIQLTIEDRAWLNKLSNDDLYAILKCERYKELDGKIPAMRRLRLDKIATQLAAPIKVSGNKITQALVDLLNPISYAFLLIDTVYTLVTSIALLTFVATSLAFLGVFAIVGAIYFVGMYKELKHEDEKRQRDYKLLALQNACADIYLKRKNISPHELDLNSPELKAKISEKLKKKRWTHAKEVVGTGILVASTLFYTYYAVALSLTIAFAGAAFVGVMTGGIGIGIVIGVSLLVGAFFAYKKYQLDKRNHSLDIKRKEMQKVVDEKIDLCRRVRHGHKLPSHHHRAVNTQYPRNVAAHIHSWEGVVKRKRHGGPFPFFKPTTAVSHEEYSSDSDDELLSKGRHKKRK